MERFEFAVTTSGAGAATVYAGPAHGFVRQIRYVPDGTVPIDTNGDIAITLDGTGFPVLTQANIGTTARTWVPMQPTHGNADGAAAKYAAAGEAVNGPIAVAGERLKLEVTNGDASKKGTFYVWVG